MLLMTEVLEGAMTHLVRGKAQHLRSDEYHGLVIPSCRLTPCSREGLAPLNPEGTEKTVSKELVVLIDVRTGLAKFL